MSEKEVFIQKVSDEEMEAVAGGKEGRECSGEFERHIYYPSFPNCAATVEDGSNCWSNDACFVNSVVYMGMQDCAKAWE